MGYRPRWALPYTRGMTPGPAPTGPDPYAADGAQRRKTIIAAVAGALAIGVLAGIGGMRLLDASRRTPGPVLAQKATTPPPALAQVAQSRPALEQTATAPAPKSMPADVRAWLEHLERIERKRGDLSRSGTSKITAMAPGLSAGMGDVQVLKDFANAADDPMNAPDPKSPSDRVGDFAGDMERDWTALQAEYDSVPPPAPCRNLANSYRNTLRETGAMIVDITRVIGEASSDPSAAVAKLQAIQDKKQSQAIDKYGKDSDAELGRICDTYETRKWFAISSDFGGGGILDKF